jgi:hypothetical protein
LNYSRSILKDKIHEINKFGRRAKKHPYKTPKQALGPQRVKEHLIPKGQRVLLNSTIWEITL